LTFNKQKIQRLIIFDTETKTRLKLVFLDINNSNETVRQETSDSLSALQKT